jgi:hypothetical protein
MALWVNYDGEWAVCGVLWPKVKVFAASDWWHCVHIFFCGDIPSGVKDFLIFRALK